MIIKHAVKSLSEYISLITDINNEEENNTWFRGHSSAKYRLIPSVLRDTVPLRGVRGNALRGDEVLISEGNLVTGINAERMLNEFKRRAIPFLNFYPRNDFEWLFLMQHHGVPTRLLDWTTNALVALYFAVEYVNSNNKSARNAATKFVMNNDEFRDDGVAIFCINPNKLNSEFLGISHPIDISEDIERWKPYTHPTCSSEIDTDFPICILAPHIIPRIRAQSGTFTLHGSNIWSLDYYEVLRPLIYKIFIPYSKVPKIQQELYSVGITTSFIYPDIDGLSREIKIQEYQRYTNERKNYLSNF